MKTIAGVEFTNLDRVQRAIIASGAQGAKAAAKALRNEAQEVLARARDLVPVDTGALKASGRVRPETGVYDNNRTMEVLVTFGATAVGYAVFVHENLGAYHVVGQAKYLEIPLIQQSYGLADRIADKVEATMRTELGRS